MYEYEPRTVVEVIAPCGVENKLQSFFPNKIFTHAPELSSTVRRVTTPLAGNITHTLRHALLAPFFQTLLISPPSFLHRGEFFSPRFSSSLPSRVPSSTSQQSLMAAAGRQMRLNKVDPNTLLVRGVAEPQLHLNRAFLETHFSPPPLIARHCRRASGAGESRRRNYSNCRAAHSRVGNKAVDCLLSHS